MLSARVSEVKDRVLGPAAPEDRIAMLDVLRGFAMFGVLWSNLNVWYGTTAPTTAVDRSLSWIQEWLVGSRFYTLLGFLFGIGFAIQLQRAEARSSEARNIFLRRMLVLLVFGLVHGLFIWRGDILTEYALLGFLLVLYRGLSQRRLAVAAALTCLLLPYLIPRIFILLNITPGGGGFLYNKAGASIYAHGTFTQIAIFRIQDFLWKLRNLATSGIFAEFLALFLLGMLAARAGIVSKLSAHARQNIRWLRWALAAALLCIAAGSYRHHNLQAWWPASLPAPAQPPTWQTFWSPRGTFHRLSYNLPIWGTSAAYVSALAMLSLQPGWSARLAPLAAVGRMPLTTYLTQSVICTTLFYGYGFGLWGRVGFAGMLGITVTIFALQLVASFYWLRRFRFGPAEWLWRSTAYLRAQPMRPVLPPTAKSVASEQL